MANEPPNGRTGPAYGEAELRTRFIEPVFLIAAGLRKREELFAANPRRHPYCNELRLGIQRFAALHAQYAEDNQVLRNLLDGLSESSFIRAWCTRDLSTWIEQWTPAAREELGDLECLELGPFAEVDGGFFNITEDCLEFLRLNGNGSTDDLHENRVYSMLRDAGQTAYVFRPQIPHPAPHAQLGGTHCGGPREPRRARARSARPRGNGARRRRMGPGAHRHRLRTGVPWP